MINSARLDGCGLRTGIAGRRQRIDDLEQQLVSECERAAAHRASPSVRIDDRETWDRATWDRATWDRYLTTAAGLELDYGPWLRQLYREIDQLERLAALPLAA